MEAGQAAEAVVGHVLDAFEWTDDLDEIEAWVEAAMFGEWLAVGRASEPSHASL